MLVLLGGVVVSVAASIVLARRMVKPIRALQAGAQGIGAGQLDQRIEVRTGDEIEALASQFNTMAEQLRESYATLEQKVAQRTHALSEKNVELNSALESLARTQAQLMEMVEQLTEQRRLAESANLAKSRFLAAASHDLRQPMHALNLYLGALANLDLPASGSRLVANLRQCAQSLDDLFDGLLDISRLDANVVEPDVGVFPLAPLLNRLRIQFAQQALAKGLELRVVASTAFVRSDVALLERIVRNLVSNAVRYTVRGKILVGCRRVQGQAADRRVRHRPRHRARAAGTGVRRVLPGRQSGARPGQGPGAGVVDRAAACQATRGPGRAGVSGAPGINVCDRSAPGGGSAREN
ncbi:HAMP domain-containing protein [Polaromonas sp. P1-6]|nr:HAMP domain-containing protein [Polaromonas sp. P1-6]